MKFVKWKSLIITCIICLLPILLGIGLWKDLPDSVAIHFNFYNEPDGFASKEFAVFGLPVMMAVLQIVCCAINDINTFKYGERKKFTTITKWIIPVMTMLLQIVTLVYALGRNIDIRKVVALIVGSVFLVIGNYLPKFDSMKNIKVDSEKTRKINRFLGFETVIMGLLILLTVFLPPMFSFIWLFLLIPYSIISIVYSIKIARKNS